MAASLSPRRGFEAMTPELCRMARTALGVRHAHVAGEIGVRPAEVMRYELGKPVDPEVVAGLRAFFEAQRLAVLRSRDGLEIAVPIGRGIGRGGC